MFDFNLHLFLDLGTQLDLVPELPKLVVVSAGSSDTSPVLHDQFWVALEGVLDEAVVVDLLGLVQEPLEQGLDRFVQEWLSRLPD